MFCNIQKELKKKKDKENRESRERMRLVLEKREESCSEKKRLGIREIVAILFMLK